MMGLGEEVPRGVWEKQSDPQVRLRSLTISFVLLYCGIRGAEVKTVSRFLSHASESHDQHDSPFMGDGTVREPSTPYSSGTRRATLHPQVI